MKIIASKGNQNAVPQQTVGRLYVTNLPVGRTSYSIFVHDERPDGISYYQDMYSLVIVRLPREGASLDLENQADATPVLDGLSVYDPVSNGNLPLVPAEGTILTEDVIYNNREGFHSRILNYYVYLPEGTDFDDVKDQVVGLSRNANVSVSYGSVETAQVVFVIVEDTSDTSKATQQYSITFLSKDDSYNNKWLRDVTVSVNGQNYGADLSNGTESTVEMRVNGSREIQMTLDVITDVNADGEPTSVVTINGWKAEWDGKGVVVTAGGETRATYVAKYVELDEDIRQRFDCVVEFVEDANGDYIAGNASGEYLEADPNDPAQAGLQHYRRTYAYYPATNGAFIYNAATDTYEFYSSEGLYHTRTGLPMNTFEDRFDIKVFDEEGNLQQTFVLHAFDYDRPEYRYEKDENQRFILDEKGEYLKGAKVVDSEGKSVYGPLLYEAGIYLAESAPAIQDDGNILTAFNPGKFEYVATAKAESFWVRASVMTPGDHLEVFDSQGNRETLTEQMGFVKVSFPVDDEGNVTEDRTVITFRVTRYAESGYELVNEYHLLVYYVDGPILTDMKLVEGNFTNPKTFDPPVRNYEGEVYKKETGFGVEAWGEYLQYGIGWNGTSYTRPGAQISMTVLNEFYDVNGLMVDDDGNNLTIADVSAALTDADRYLKDAAGKTSDSGYFKALFRQDLLNDDVEYFVIEVKIAYDDYNNNHHEGVYRILMYRSENPTPKVQLEDLVPFQPVDQERDLIQLKSKNFDDGKRVDLNAPDGASTDMIGFDGMWAYYMVELDYDDPLMWLMPSFVTGEQTVTLTCEPRYSMFNGPMYDGVKTALDFGYDYSHDADFKTLLTVTITDVADPTKTFNYYVWVVRGKKQSEPRYAQDLKLFAGET